MALIVVSAGRRGLSMSTARRTHQGPSNALRCATQRPMQSAGSRRRVCVVSAEAMKVLVTGASGRTGSLVVKKLVERGGFEPVGLVRSEKSADKVQKKTGLSRESIFLGDITAGSRGLRSAMEGADAVVLCTSAIPQLIPWSILPVLWAKITGKEGVRPEFKFPEGQEPKAVDWEGAKAQIDAANEAGVKHFVFVSSMGGTQPDNFLNTMGNGNILLWKRKAEEYLIKSGMEYTIIHPGGLTLDKGSQREILIGVDDELIGPDVPRSQRRIPRADVAEVCVQSLALAESRNRSFDIASLEPGEGERTTDFGKLFSRVTRNCDYKISNRPATM